MKNLLFVSLSLFFFGCSIQKESCEYTSAKLYFFPLHYTSPYSLKINYLKKIAEIKKETEDAKFINDICGNIVTLSSKEKQQSSFDVRLVMVLYNKNKTDSTHLAVSQLKNQLFYNEKFYDCDEDCQEKIVNPMLERLGYAPK